MAQNFLSCDRDQALLLPPSLREWLADDHLAWFVLEVVDELDLAAFYGAYREDGHGRAAHDPAMMVALLVYAYAIGVRSSRAIERRCREDVAFRVIAANQAPDHATIARFRARHETAIAALFGGVLELCAQAGLVELGVVMVDGTRIAASAADRQTRSYEQIAKEILGEAAAIDAAEDERYAMSAATSCRRGFATRVIAARGCARPSRRWTPNAPRRPRRFLATAASGCMSAAGVFTRTGRWSVG
jgi:transposase